MYEALNQWDYVAASYAAGLGGLALLTCWSWTAMRRAETRRDKARRR